MNTSIDVIRLAPKHNIREKRFLIDVIHLGIKSNEKTTVFTSSISLFISIS